jgi:DNA-binding transcriptional regulator YiaG
MTYFEIRSLLSAIDPQAVRRQAGISVAVMAAALGVPEWKVGQWERRRRPPRGLVAYSYTRVIAGLARHLEIDRSGDAVARNWKA